MLIGVVIVWVVALASYLCLAGSLDRVELVAALVCATVASGSALALHRVAERRFRLQPPLRAILGPLRALVTETLVVGRVLAQAVAGHAAAGKLQRQPFERGGDDAVGAGRRAAVFIGLSLAPQSFVIDEEPGALLIHSLPAKPVSPDRRWPT